MTDKELERIYNEAYRAVYWTAMSLLKNEADAEDVVQDTFVTLIESYETIIDKNKVIPWLKKIAANKSLNRLTRTKTDVVEEEFFEDVEAVSENFLPDDIVESAEMRKIIMDIIKNSLSDDIRRTLILFYFNDMSTKEISEKLGVPEGTVRWRLNFARNKIKKEVEKYEEDNDTKLFGMVALPFLSKLFMKEAEQLPMKAMPASLNAILSASKNAPSDGTGIKASKKAVKKGIDIMNKKLLIGCVAGVVAIGASVAIIVNVANKNSDIGSDSKPSDQLIQTESLQENESGNADGMTELDYTENNSASDNPAETQMPVLEPDDVIEVGDFGSKSYSLTIYNIDGSVLEYTGSTDCMFWSDLFAEIAANSDFSYEMIGNGDNFELVPFTQTFSSVNGQQAANNASGYFAFWFNGIYIDEPGNLTTTMSYSGNEAVIRYVTTNFLPSDNCYIPTSDTVFSIGIVTPSGASYNIDINSTAESAVLRPNYSYTRMEGSEYITGNFSLEFWSDILGVIQSIPDLDVQGQMISSAPDGYYTVFINGYECFTADPTGALADFLASCESHPGFTAS